MFLQRSHKELPFSEVSFAVLSTHLILFLIPVSFLLLVFEPSVLFHWHPAIMLTSFVLLMSEGIITAKCINPNTKSVWSIVHSYIQLTCAILSLFGFFVIAFTKLRDEDDHFKSWHSYFGAFVLLFNFLQTYIGLRLHHPSHSNSFFSHLGDDKLFDVDPNLLKTIHKHGSIITYFASLGTICLGIWNVPKVQETVGEGAMVVVFIVLMGVGVRVVLIKPKKVMVWRADDQVLGFHRVLPGRDDLS
eukprot:TRINITY_DN27264_c0_g1_i1.p1 TRINITY_DN27264_c0_g1~~TRINITY_DN27264_c0_g1_i1.p1  ORF type:complete len:246 (-),score=15.15 TRINITY_DN27264_c0_g1_i1:43-780(-)